MAYLPRLPGKKILTARLGGSRDSYRLCSHSCPRVDGRSARRLCSTYNNGAMHEPYVFVECCHEHAMDKGQAQRYLGNDDAGVIYTIQV